MTKTIIVITIASILFLGSFIFAVIPVSAVQIWTASGPAVVTVTDADMDDDAQAQFTYFLRGSSGTWTFSTIATTTGTETINFNWRFFHAFFRVTTFLNTFDPSGTTNIISDGPISCCTFPSGGGSYLGQVTFNTVAGEPYGFTLGGSHRDRDRRVTGTFTIISETASIQGMKWNDFNADGIKDLSEPGIPGWKIGIECQDFSASTETDDLGNYSLTYIPGPNECTVSEEIRPKWTPTTPTKVDVSVEPSDRVKDVNFGNLIPPIFLVIDEDSIDNGNPPNFFDGDDVNEDNADIGVRAQLPFFANNVGNEITLHTGEVGDEGWFALKTIPDEWNDAGPTTDGLRNFFLAGPGLGTADGDGDREAQLDKIPDVTPLRAAGLKSLEGEIVCAVVYDSDVSMNFDPLNGSLKGSNLGIVAFEVLKVTQLTGFSDSSLPQVDIGILDANRVCEGPLELLTAAPEPISSSEPEDVVP